MFWVPDRTGSHWTGLDSGLVEFLDGSHFSNTNFWYFIYYFFFPVNLNEESTFNSTRFYLVPCVLNVLPLLILKWMVTEDIYNLGIHARNTPTDNGPLDPKHKSRGIGLLCCLFGWKTLESRTKHDNEFLPFQIVLRLPLVTWLLSLVVWLVGWCFAEKADWGYILCCYLFAAKINSKSSKQLQNERTTFQHIYSVSVFHKKLTSFIMGKPRNLKEEKANSDFDVIIYIKPAR